MKYLIWSTNTNKFRTQTSWISNESELFSDEKMLSFNTRDEIDKLIKNARFINCCSYGISKSHPLYKHC